jgi:hypothetical protein
MPSAQVTFDFTDNPLSQSSAWNSSYWQTNGVRAIVGHLVQSANVTHCGIRYNGGALADHYAECQIVSLLTANAPVAGPMTRLQSGANGSGYVLTYRPNEGVLRLYKCADTGSLGFTPVGSDIAITITSQDTVRLSSTGSSHAVYFNGVLKATISDSTYTGGQPGGYIYASNKNDIGVTQFNWGDANGDNTISFDSALDSNWQNPCGAFAAINRETYYALPATASTQVASRYETDYGNAQYSEIVQGNVSSNGWIGPSTRMQTGGSFGGYTAALIGTGSNNLILYKVAGSQGAPTFTDIGHVTATVPTLPLDLWLQSSGSTHTVYLNGVQQLQVTDATYTSGRVGIAFSGALGLVQILQWTGGDNADRPPRGWLPFLASTAQLFPPIHPGPDQSASLPFIPSGTRVWPGILRNLLLGQSTFGVTEYPLSDGGLWNCDVWNIPGYSINTWPNLPQGNPLGPTGVHGMWQLRAHVKGSSTNLYCGMRRNASFNSDQYAFAVITCPLSDNNPFVGPMTRMQGSANPSGYAVLYHPLQPAITLNKIVDGSTLVIVAINAGGTGYSLNDILTVVQGGGSGGTVKVTGVSSGAVTAVSIQAAGTGYASANGLSTTGGTGTGCTLNIITTAATAIGADITITRGIQDVVGLVSFGSTHRIYYNQQLVGTRTDSTYTGGQPGIFSLAVNDECFVSEFRCGNAPANVPADIVIHDDGQDTIINFDSGIDANWQTPVGNLQSMVAQASAAVEAVFDDAAFGPPPSPDHHTASRRHANLDDYQWSEAYFDMQYTGSWVGVTTRMQSDTNSGAYLVVAFGYQLDGNIRIFRVEGSPGNTTFGQNPPGVPGAELVRGRWTGTIPFWLKLVSQGQTHKAYVNNVLIIQANDNTFHGGQPGIAYYCHLGPSDGRCLQWRTGGDQLVQLPFIASGVVFYPLEAGIALFMNGPKIVYPSGGGTILRLYHLPRFVPYKQYEASRDVNVASSGCIEVIWKRTDAFLEFEMEYVRGVDMSPWNDFMQYALGKGPFDYYPDATNPNVFTTYWLDSTSWNAAYKALGLNTFKVRFRKRLS